MDYDRARRLAQELARDGIPLEERLVRLRSAGASQVTCVKLVRELEGIALGRAKTIVDESPAWADKRPVNEQVRGNATLAGEQLAADPTLLTSSDENVTE